MKILIHAHTAFSEDGELSPRELAWLAADKGFQAVLLTDHFESLTGQKFERLVKECQSITDCLMIPGYERSWDGYHVLALGVSAWFDDPHLRNWGQRVRGAGGITVAAHPSRYRHRIPDHILQACAAVEVWNSKPAYDGIVGPNPRAFPLLGKSRFPLCGQDLHGIRHATSVGIELSKNCATAQEILQSLREGKYRMINGLFHYGLRPSPPARAVLTLFHSLRRCALDPMLRSKEE